jgi:adenylate cyclase
MKRIARWARQFGIARAVCIALLLGLVPLRIADPRLLQEARLRTFDHFQVLRPREQTTRPIVIVDINEASLKQIGQWPWPRTILADLVDRLTEMGAVAIGFDVVFAEPDQLSPNLVALSLRDLDDATRTRLRSLPSNDEIFAAAIRRSRVVLGESVSDTRSDDVAIEGSGYGVVTTKGAPDPRTFLFSFPGLVHNIPIL